MTYVYVVTRSICWEEGEVIEGIFSTEAKAYAWVKSRSILSKYAVQEMTVDLHAVGEACAQCGQKAKLAMDAHLVICVHKSSERTMEGK